MAKKYKVGFKTINAKLEVTKHHLKNIRGQVSSKDQKRIDAQVKAIDVILSACVGRGPRMSAYYTGKDD